MAISNKERVGRALDVLRPELKKYVEQELRDVYGDDWEQYLADGHETASGPKLDTQRLINTILKNWDDVFEPVLTKEDRNLCHEVRKWRNKHGHEEPWSFDDTLNALLDIQKLLEGIKSPAYEQVESAKMEIMRLQFDTERKKEEKRSANLPLAGLEVPGLRPWREIITPHQDVAKGDFQQAEFAADLWQVYQGEGGAEYRDPIAFFGRTYLTGGLSELLVNGLKRLSGKGGDPVVELQINFGGGKTHSMLALYHLFGGQAPPADLPGVDAILASSGIAELPTVARAVIVGTPMRPGSPTTKEDGTVVKTIWGEIAWQLAGKKGFDLVREADETATNPGDLLDELFKMAGPSLILIDEWVAYARQLFDRQNMLPAGDFDTQFTFAQALCEAARRAKNVLVCISIPASTDREGNPTVGGQAGDRAGITSLEKLKAAVGRSNLAWRPATSDESFDIVRRRLFQPIPGDLEAARDAVIKEFAVFYRANPNEFPSECRDGDYERRMKACYPIHPELFDRLYLDWSTLEKFQRTRGVLRLMAEVIHSLWKNGDPGALIMPAMVPLADPRVQTEILRYLPDSWPAVIDRDVDGENSVPMKLDAEYASTSGKYSASRRVARAIFMGSAPTKDAATTGVEEKRVRLGCVQPKETIATFGDALGRLRQKTMFLYQDSSKYWYNTQASVNREAQDRAGRFTADEVNAEIVARLKELARNRGEFSAVHVDLPTGEINDDRELRLVVLGPKHLHKQGRVDSDAIGQAKEALANRGSAPRKNRNRLVFLAGDEARSADLEAVVRQFLAWKSIVADVQAEKVELDKANRDQANASVNQWTGTVSARVGETYKFVLVPYQSDPKGELTWSVLTVGSGTESLTARVIKKLEPEHIVRKLGGNLLVKDLDRVPLWDPAGHVSMSQLAEYYASYPYLYRILDDSVLSETVREAVNGMDGPAYADAYDSSTKSYTRLRSGVLLDGPRLLDGVLVKAVIANPLIDEANRKAEADGIVTPPEDTRPGRGEVSGGFFGSGTVSSPPKPKTTHTRFHASVDASAGNLASVAGNVSREVVQHLAGILGSKVEITIEISAESPDGYGESVMRIVNENCRTLKFESFEFEEE